MAPAESIDLRVVSAYRAQPIGGVAPPDVELHITEAFPSLGYDVPIEESRRLHVRDGSNIEAALFASLPGGTYDVLLGLMLARRASMFVVPFDVGASRTTSAIALDLLRHPAQRERAYRAEYEGNFPPPAPLGVGEDPANPEG